MKLRPLRYFSRVSCLPVPLLDIVQFQAKLMIEAYRFGDVGTLRSLLLSLSADELPSPLWKQACAAVNAAGMFALTFKDNETAKKFVLSGTLATLVGPESLALWMPFISVDSNDSDHRSHENPYTGHAAPTPHVGTLVEVPPPAEETTVDQSTLEQEAADVEDFLNSLL